MDSFKVTADGTSFWSGPGGSGAGGASTAASVSSGPQPITEKLNRDDNIPVKPVAAMSYGGRVRITRLWQSHEELIGTTIRVAGWAKEARDQKDVVFIKLNDGSCFNNLQVVVPKDHPSFAAVAATKVGASLICKGKLIKSPAKGQPFELSVQDAANDRAELISNTDADYPLQGRPEMEVSESSDLTFF